MTALKTAWDTAWNGLTAVVTKVLDAVVAAVTAAVGKITSAIAKIGSAIAGLAGGGAIGGAEGNPTTMATGGMLSPPVTMAASGTSIGGGFETSGPQVIVGEGRAAYPEFVIPTDPQHRENATALYGALGSHIGGAESGTSLGGPSSGYWWEPLTPAGRGELMSGDRSKEPSGSLDLTDQQGQYLDANPAGLSWLETHQSAIMQALAAMSGSSGGASTGGTGSSDSSSGIDNSAQATWAAASAQQAQLETLNNLTSTFSGLVGPMQQMIPAAAGYSQQGTVGTGGVGNVVTGQQRADGLAATAASSGGGGMAAAGLQSLGSTITDAIQNTGNTVNVHPRESHDELTIANMVDSKLGFMGGLRR
jgi:hypothetical protein